jgi:superfamily II RNA helicase
LEKWPTLHRLQPVFLRGIAFHHAGLLPALKEIVETLFGENLIRVMYATETFAVGINYPVRSVCFDAPTKWDGVTFRPMTTLEYFQMAGRAGRRGIDEKGFVYILANLDRYRLEEFPSTNPDDVEELTSRFNLSYNSILNLFHNYKRGEILVILNRNFATYQARNNRVSLENRLDRLAAELEKTRSVICQDWGSLSCPQMRAVALRQLRRKERRLRYIRGKKARRAISAEVRELKESLAKLAERDCSPAEQARCEKRAKTYEKLYKERLSLEEQMRNLQVAGRFEADLEAKAAILEDLNYLDADEKLLPRGLFAMQIYAQELLITELYFAGFFHEWDEDQINAVIVAVDYEPRKGERLPRQLPFEYKPIRKIIRDLIFRHGVGEGEIRFFPSLSPLAYEWSRGCDFFTLTRNAPELQEGDIVSGFRRGIDLLRQIRAACLEEDPPMAAKIKNCMEKMDRDLVQVNL